MEAVGIYPSLVNEGPPEIRSDNDIIPILGSDQKENVGIM
jgi:hypothetical protein